MIPGCGTSPTPDRFASELLAYLDCQTVALGSRGFAAMSAPGSSAALLLGALLTVFIVLIGYRLLFGETLGVREGALAAAKVGVVLAFTTNWQAYRTVIFDVVLRAPADLAAEIGRPTGLPGASGGLAMRLDGADRDFRLLAIYGTGMPSREQGLRSNGIAPPMFANFDVFALGLARILFLVGGLGALALARIGAGVLLAFGPLFVSFALFPVTFGLAEAWLRGLVATMLASAGVAVAIGVELGLLEPWLSQAAALRASGIAIPGVPGALLAAVAIFTCGIVGVASFGARIAFGLRLARGGALRSSTITQGAGDAMVGVDGQAIPTTSSKPPSRAMLVAGNIAAMQRREERDRATIVRERDDGLTPTRSSGDIALPSAAASGRGLGRRSRPRGSRIAQARDSR